MGKLIDSDALKSVFRRHYPINYKILSTIIDDMPDAREPKKPCVDDKFTRYDYYCGECGHQVGYISKVNGGDVKLTPLYCSHCGRKVDWS